MKGPQLIGANILLKDLTRQLKCSGSDSNPGGLVVDITSHARRAVSTVPPIISLSPADIQWRQYIELQAVALCVRDKIFI